MRKTATTGVMLALSLAAAPALAATAEFIDREGRNVGTAALTEAGQGVIIRAELQELPEGWHGLHIHQTGKCDGPDFKSAGGHFNPGRAKHGFKGEHGPHAGDLPNIYVQSDGTAKLEIFTDHASLGGDDGILDADGSALVIHAGADDYRTDPAGASGDRIACAVIMQ